MRKKLFAIVTIFIFLLASCSVVLSKEIYEHKYLEISSDLKQTKTIINSDLPSYWNWKDIDGIDWTTPAKNQGRTETCGAFAIIGSLESIIKIREGCSEFTPDLSEQYYVSCTAMGMMNGTTFEFCFPFKGHFIPCSDKSPDWEKYFVPCSSEQFKISATREFIKNKLIEHGPIALNIHVPGYINFFSNGFLGLWGKFHHEPDEYYSRVVPKFLGTYHWVLLVGWKDDPENIKNGGYWIIKNSWGSDWGYDGFFNLEYGSLNSDLGILTWVDYDPDDFNWPPIGSPTLNGPTYMEANVEYELSFSSIDPEGDAIFYNFSWDDGTYSVWLGPYDSGETCHSKHIWDEEGCYKVRVKAKNENGLESDWMPMAKSKAKSVLPVDFLEFISVSKQSNNN